MFVSVVIPCYNQTTTLERAIASVCAQTYTSWECIVVDDGSDVPIKVGDERVEVIRITNRGLPSARNTGLMNAQGTAFLPLDADDYIDPTYLEKTVPLIKKGADVVLTGIQEFGLRTGCFSPGFNLHPDLVTAELLLDTYNRFFYCSLMRTSALRRVGGYNARMNRGLEDVDLWVDLKFRGMDFKSVDEPLFFYNTSSDGMLATIHRDGGYEHMLSEMRRHHRR